jgi:SAM-dependent methyltransferase
MRRPVRTTSRADPQILLMTAPASPIQADFDRLALLSSGGWDHNHQYHNFLLKRLPAHGSQALEIGCGTGDFSRLIARRFDQVLALDLSPQMIRLAQEHTPTPANIEWQVADALTYDLPPAYFDGIVSIATLHHLPLAQILLKMREALAPGGTLLVLDLFLEEGLSDLLISAMALPVDVALRLTKTGRLRPPREVREAWAVHGQSDVYPALSHVRQVCAQLLPGARVKRHLLWRYSLVWIKPE